MKKQTLISLLLVLMLALLAACSSGGADTESGGEEQEVQATEAPAEEEEMEEEEEADSGEIVGQEETSQEDTTVVETSEFGEAPMLAEMVAAGDLPPVAERLPVKDDIQVIEPVDGIGQYGGTWHNQSNVETINNIKMVLYDPPVRWRRDYSGYEPGLAKSFSYNDEGTELTWVFREGVKWSDGTPFTTADLQFWWEDIATNDDYKVVQVPWWGFNTDGSNMDVSFPDDYTMVMKWDTPRWVTTFIVAQGFWEWEPMIKPRHYLEQFHPTYSDSTYEEFEQADKWYLTPDYPTIFAWYVESVTPGERTVLVRNPYYWKVDPEGNQLPYIDRIDIAIVPDEQVRVLEASAGKYDAAFRATTNPTDIPILLEQAEDNGYHLHQGAVNGAGAWPGWIINQNFSDESVENWEEIGDLLRDKNFRQGISHAMDRERLIDVAWDGIGTPKQATISPQAWHFNSSEGQAVFEEWANAYAAYDPDLANELLEAANFTDQDGDGFRDLPSGAPFQLILDLGDWGGERLSIAATESFAGDLEAIGVNVLVNNLIGQPDWQLRQDEGLFMFRNTHASELDIWTYPDWLFPLRNNRAWPQEGRWRQTGGEEGWEPAPDSPAARLQALYDQGLATETIEERHALVWEAVQIHLEEGPFTLGAAGDQPMPVVVGDHFHGIPDLVILGPWAPGSPGNLNPEQFWMDQ